MEIHTRHGLGCADCAEAAANLELPREGRPLVELITDAKGRSHWARR